METSFHPVDVELIRGRLVPAIRGEGSIEDLVARAVSAKKTRLRAKAWANALAQQQMIAQMPEGLELPGTKRLPAAVAPSLEGFNKDLHAAGRPFFIVADTPAEVSAAIDRYLAAASESDVDAIAREMLARLHPELPGLVEPEGPPAPSDGELAASIRSRLDLLNAAFRVNPKRLVAREVAHACLELHSLLRPAWTARGNCWPTLFARELIPLFETAESWLGPLAGPLDRTVTGDACVGGFVPAERVAIVKEQLDAQRLSFETQLREEGTDESEVPLVLRKLEEAVSDAASRGLGFCEASGIA